MSMTCTDCFCRVVGECSSLDLVHRTEVEDVPTAICPYNGRVLIGVGRLLRIYDLGKKKLLRKCENKVITRAFVFLVFFVHCIWKFTLLI